jgi:hypothetical protein
MAVSRLEDVAALVIGGIAGSMAAALLVRAGVRPERAAAATAVGGVALALAGSREARLAGAGAAAAGTGQLAMAWMQREKQLAARNAGLTVRVVVRPGGRRWRPRGIEEAFALAREQIEMEDEARAMARWFAGEPLSGSPDERWSEDTETFAEAAGSADPGAG